ncbi:MAG: DUF4910 domain-containing protein [Candidatus Heimdallarchaeota archaeon]|nr:DUF4910 domain-containing protein [Candidatus Heimdallarchaeota archaeon]MBY8993604.1 DUF4910 domain-containing protein [Candidatus Heimdallarchaeota archaeon]
MFKKIYDLISKEFSGKNTKEVIGGIANFHRIQSSPGFREAANYCHKQLENYNIPLVKTHSYPATGSNSYWGCPVPKEWGIKSATLELIEPNGTKRNLCRFFENPCSVIQRSKATPPEGITGEVVILPKGLKDEELEKLDLKGKFILTDDSDLKRLRLIAVNKLGAAGIIYDLVSELKPIRTRANFPTARRYTSFWYGTKGDEGDALGFVLSAEQGNDLRTLIKRTEKGNEVLKKEGKPIKQVQVHAKIDSSFYDGAMEVVEFFIPGKEKGQEIIAVAHLCHPKPGAIDNASGCGALIEVARALNNLISSGELEQPKRGIRFLLMAEFTGTYCYLATNEKKISNFVAGINLDMVGADQTVGGGRTLIMEKTHNALPSYVNDVLSAMLTEASKEVLNFQGTGGFATFKFANDQPFSGGSDHVVLGHPDVGIGTPMFIQWPDRYYHTGEDTLEKVSVDMLHLIGSLTASYCYFLANAELPDILWIAREVAVKGKARITSLSREMLNNFLFKLKSKAEAPSKKKETDKPTEDLSKEQLVSEILMKIESQILFRRDREHLTLDSVEILTKNKEEKDVLKNLLKEMKEGIDSHAKAEIIDVKAAIKQITESMNIKEEPLPKREKSKDDAFAKKMIPIKLIRGPVSGLSLMDVSYDDSKLMQKINEKYKGMSPTLSSALFWLDGYRTLAEIAKLVEHDVGKVSIPYLVKFLDIYKKYGLIDYKEK